MFLIEKRWRDGWMQGEASGTGHAKCAQLRTVGGVAMSHVYIRIYTISFLVFGSIFLFLF